MQEIIKAPDKLISLTFLKNVFDEIKYFLMTDFRIPVSKNWQYDAFFKIS